MQDVKCDKRKMRVHILSYVMEQKQSHSVLHELWKASKALMQVVKLYTWRLGLLLAGAGLGWSCLITRLAWLSLLSL